MGEFMCFCASASFAAAGFLSLIGIGAQYKASKPQRMFAAIPFLFALQQLAEGVIWVTAQLSLAHQLATYIFLLFAFLVWPVWIPLSIFCCERERWRKKVLINLLIIGSSLSVFIAGVLGFYGATSTATGKHIVYSIPAPYENTVFFAVLAVYLVVTGTPFLISSVRVLRIFGILLAVSCCLSFAFGAAYFISVWCFYAALLSLGVLFAISEFNHQPNP